MNNLPLPTINYYEELTKISSDDVKLTSNQINRILNLTDENGKKITDSHHLFYQVLVDVMQYITFIDTYLAIVEVLPTWNEKILNPISFKTQKNNYDGDIDKQLRNTTVITGIIACPQCTSMLTTSVSIQTSSGDEATKLFSRCFNCGKRWSA